MSHGRRKLVGDRLHVVALECTFRQLQVGGGDAHRHVHSHDLGDVSVRASLHEAEDCSERRSMRCSDARRGAGREPDHQCVRIARETGQRFDAIRSAERALRHELQNVDTSTRSGERQYEIGLQRLGVSRGDTESECNSQQCKSAMKHTFPPFFEFASSPRWTLRPAQS